jgi:hypothetical protein
MQLFTVLWPHRNLIRAFRTLQISDLVLPPLEGMLHLVDC